MTVIVSKALRDDILKQADELSATNRENLTKLFESSLRNRTPQEDRVTTKAVKGLRRPVRTAEEFIAHVERRMELHRS